MRLSSVFSFACPVEPLLLPVPSCQLQRKILERRLPHPHLHLRLQYRLAGMSRYMRSNMLEVIRQDYVATARAKGLPEGTVVFRHAMRNALLPVITILGLSVPDLLGGSVIFETIFAIPGMGQLFYQGVMSRDYPLIMGILTIGAFLTLLGNLLADVGYALADPRIRQG